MNRKSLFALWGVMFALCAALGFASEPENLTKALLVLAGLGFFVLGFALVRQAKKRGDGHTLALIRNLAALSLSLTAVLLILNFLSVRGSALLGNVLHAVLVIVSAPMMCCQYWAVSLFLWACLMITAWKNLKNKH